MQLLNKLIFYLKVSRPGLWFATIWLYILPTSNMDVWSSSSFWYGFFYICFPLNFLVYGWNDMVDQKTDALNPRKDTFWFGAKGTAAQLKELWKPMLIVQLLFYPYLVYIGGIKMLGLLFAFIVINGLYNLPKNGLRSHPPLELLCQIGYLLIVPLSIWLNNTDSLPWTTYFYLLLFAFQSHLIGEVMDIKPDRKADRKTTATVIGMKKTKLLIILIVLIEVTLLYTVYEEYVFGSMLAIGLVWLLIDLFLIFKTNTYSLTQMKLFGLMSNVVAIISMAYVWYSGCLV